MNSICSNLLDRRNHQEPFPNSNFFRNGHETVTEFLLAKAANVNFVNDDGYTALIYATESGQGHIVEVFLTGFFAILAVF